MPFAVVAIVLIACVAAVLGHALLRRGAPNEMGPDRDLATYRDQLREVERDAARGLIPATEAETLRAEIGRRLLAADRLQDRAAGSGTQGGRGALVALLALALAGSVALYVGVGVPGLPDLPLAKRIEDNRAARAARPSQAEAEAQMAPEAATEAAPEYLALVAQLRDTVASRPDDLAGHELLARHEAALGLYRAAYAAQGRVIELKGGAADATDFAALGELMILAAGGYASPEAEAAILAALNIDPREPRARYFAGLTMAQTGRPDVAYDFWAALWREGPADAPWMAPIAEFLPEVAAGAGRDLPDGFGEAAALPGPDRAAVEAAQDMSDADRQAMIEGMVARLAERIDAGGAGLDEHLRLIRAYGVLDRPDAARAAIAAARAAFPGQADASRIDAAARDAGLSE